MFLLIMLAAGLNACSSIPFVAANETATPTRTPRPTFTPRPSATAISEATDTPGATATSAENVAATATAEETGSAAEATATEPRATKALAKASQPPRPQNTVPPPAPTKASPPIQLEQTPYDCPQDGSFYEIVIDVRHRGNSPRKFAAGLYFAVFDPSGNLLRDASGKVLVGLTDDGGQSGYAYGSDCHRDSSSLNPIRFNGKMDVGDVVRSGAHQMIFRFVKSASDMSPQSPNVVLTFPANQADRWWLHLGAP
jgi:hypothetical protein